MNTYIDTITINHQDTGYCFSKSNHRVNLLQYADYTCLLADGPAPCRQLLETTNQWLRWSGMNPKIPKCCSLSIQASTGTPFNPELSLNDTPIPYLGDSTINFLGAPVSFVRKKMDIRQSVKTKLEVLLQRVDASLVTRQQKLRLYKLAVCPRLTWELSINSFPITFVEKDLMVLATRYLKKWAGLAKPADPSCLYLPKSTGGLELPSLVTMYKKLQTSKAATLMMSQDSTVRHLASSLTRREREKQREAFQPYREVVDVLKEEPGASRKAITRKVKDVIQKREDEAKLEHSQRSVKDPSRKLATTIRPAQREMAKTTSTFFQEKPNQRSKRPRRKPVLDAASYSLDWTHTS